MFFGAVLVRTDLLSRFPHVVLLAALLLLAWLLAHWTWVFLAPLQLGRIAETQLPALSKVLAEKVVNVHLFGGVGPSNVNTAAVAVAAAPSNIGVRGVYAGRNGRSGFAILVVDGKPVSAVVGQEFAPGMTLQRVYSDYVEILRGGQVETVRMAPLPTSSPGASSRSPSGAANMPGEMTRLQMTVRQLGPGQYGFSRTELLAMLKHPEQMRLLGRYAPHPRGGAVLELSPADGLPEKLGLKVGDVVTVINEKSLAGPGDVTRLYQQLVESERVNVGILRAGEKMNIGIQVAP